MSVCRSLTWQPIPRPPYRIYGQNAIFSFGRPNGPLTAQGFYIFSDQGGRAPKRPDTHMTSLRKVFFTFGKSFDQASPHIIHAGLL
jgi:hypothetical protein